MDSRYKVGLKLMIDGIEQTLIEDNGTRGFFQATDAKFDKWPQALKPIANYYYDELNDCKEVK